MVWLILKLKWRYSDKYNMSFWLIFVIGISEVLDVNFSSASQKNSWESKSADSIELIESRRCNGQKYCKGVVFKTGNSERLVYFAFCQKDFAHEINVSSDLPAQIELKAEEDLNFLIRSENKDKGKLLKRKTGWHLLSQNREFRYGKFVHSFYFFPVKPFF